MDLKTKLLHELTTHTLVRLSASSVHGIGVFAIQDIPKGVRTIFSDEPGEWVTLRFDEVAQLPQSSIDLIENFCLFDEQNYFVPAHGFKNMDLSLYLNHSDHPNIISIDEGRYFESIRDIQKGEELFIDYGTIVKE